MDFRYYLDCDRSIRSYDFTHRSAQNLKRIFHSDQFEEESAELIYDYLINEMEIVLFNDYLKRFLYKKCALDKPFESIPDDEYVRIIMESFAQNATPAFFGTSGRTLRQFAKNILSTKTVGRDTVFLLGFGLKMLPPEVSEFLVKVLKTDDFDFSDPREIIFWYCYRTKSSFAHAQDLILKAKTSCTHSDVEIHNVRQIENEDQLLSYLNQEKVRSTREKNKEISYNEFFRLMDLTKKIAVEKYKDQEDFGHKATNYYVEKILNIGVPNMNHSDTFIPAHKSTLYPFAQQNRLTRQRINKIESGKTAVARTDLITLQFFIYANNKLEMDPADRFREYIDETNDILKRCGMLTLYPVNPYESMILLCLLSDYPYETYADITDLSYTS